MNVFTYYQLRTGYGVAAYFCIGGALPREHSGVEIQTLSPHPLLARLNLLQLEERSISLYFLYYTEIVFLQVMYPERAPFCDSYLPILPLW